MAATGTRFLAMRPSWMAGRALRARCGGQRLTAPPIPAATFLANLCRIQLHPRQETAYIESEPTNSQPGMPSPASVKKKWRK